MTMITIQCYEFSRPSSPIVFLSDMRHTTTTTINAFSSTRLMLSAALHLVLFMLPVRQEDEAFIEGLALLMDFEGVSPVGGSSTSGGHAGLTAPSSASAYQGGTHQLEQKKPQQQQQQQQLQQQQQQPQETEQQQQTQQQVRWQGS